MPLLPIAIFFYITFVDIFACPPDQDIEPCVCEVRFVGSVTTCENIIVNRVRGILATIASTQKSIRLVLKRIELCNLTSSFLVGLDLVSLSAEHFNLSSVDDNAFDDVSGRLEKLSLSYNALKSVPSGALKKLSSLKALWLDYNKLELLHAEAFMGPRGLSKLSLKGNKIKFIDESAFVGIERFLRELYLGENELTAIPSQQLSGHFSLWRLQLHDNRISTLQPDGLPASFGRSLTILGLANNTIRQLPPRAFVSLRGLESLNLNGNLLESLHSSSFQGVEGTLSRLAMRKNRLSEIPAAPLRNLSRLEYIDLEGNEISTVRRDDFLRLKKIRTIGLNNNSLTYIDPKAFVDLVDLRDLNLHSNRLNTVPYETYAPVLDTLQSFDIHDNPLRCDCEIPWLIDWVVEKGMNVVKMRNETKCACPEEFVDMPIADVPKDRLICPGPAHKQLQNCNSRASFVSNSRSLAVDCVIVILIVIVKFYFTVALGTS